MAMFEKVRAEKPSFVEAIKVPLAAVLASPHFLYPRRARGARRASRASSTPTSWPRGSRISSGRRCRMTSFSASRRAATCASPRCSATQVDRMLADPKSDAFVKNFAGQWLGLRKVGANPPVKNLYPEYDRHLETLDRARERGVLRGNPAPRPRRAEPHQERLRHDQRAARALLRHPRREGRRDPPRARAARVASRRGGHAGVDSERSRRTARAPRRSCAACGC